MDINTSSFLSRFVVKTPAKNEERKRLIQELSDATGWKTRAIYFQTIGWPDTWLEDALTECRHYSNPKLRNLKFKQFLQNARSQPKN